MGFHNCFLLTFYSLFSVESPALLFTKFFPVTNELIYLLGELTVVIGNSAFERWIMDYYGKFWELFYVHCYFFIYDYDLFLLIVSKDVNIS